MKEQRYGLVIDQKRCIGCHTCTIACKMENNVPLGLTWNRVLTKGGHYQDIPAGDYPYLNLIYQPIGCQHCAQAPCVRACPVKATYIRNDGIVMIDWNQCIGCRYCMVACPYSARVFNWQTPRQMPSWPIGSPAVPPHQRGVVEKCTLCFHRVDRGQEPFCVITCPSRARYFGNLNDSDSQVFQLSQQPSAYKLLAEKGTDPSVIYLL
jgi:molybdopterin-containing oxidoreductase family iron-sulfur binding subunit